MQVSFPPIRGIWWALDFRNLSESIVLGSDHAHVTLARDFYRTTRCVRESVAFDCCFDAASQRSFAEWKAEQFVHRRVLQSWGLEAFGPEVF